MPPARKPRNKLLIATLIALIVIILGGSALAAVIFLRGKQPSNGTTVIQTPGATLPTGSGHPMLIPGSPCAQAAANPTGPASKPGGYNASALIYHATGSPAFLGASRQDGSVYYSDQTAQAIYVLSPAISRAFVKLSGVPQPSGIAIAPDSPYVLYYLQQGAAGQQGINVNGSGIQAAFQDNGIEIVPGFNPLVGFALGLNPTNDALLVPSPTNGTIACLSNGSHSLSAPFITGLKEPVAAAVDAQGNVYVADDGTNLILRFNGHSGQVDWKQPFTAPQDVIVDADGYLVATVLGSAPGQGSLVRLNPTTGVLMTTLASHLQEPRGVTLNTTSYHTDGLYFIDQGAQAIYELQYNPKG